MQNSGNPGVVSARPSHGLLKNVLDLGVRVMRLNQSIVLEDPFQCRRRRGRSEDKLRNAISCALRLLSTTFSESLRNTGIANRSGMTRG